MGTTMYRKKNKLRRSKLLLTRSKNNRKKMNRHESTRKKLNSMKTKRNKMGGITLKVPSNNTQIMADSLLSNDPKYVAAKYAIKQSNKFTTDPAKYLNKSKLVGSTMKASNIMNASKLASTGVPSYHTQYNPTSISTMLPTTSM